MPHKKQKRDTKDTEGMQDIRSFLKKTDTADSSSSTTSESTQRSGAADCKTATWSEVKKENNGDSTDGHLHRFKVKFGHSDTYKYPVDCYQPRTVLEAIKSIQIYSQKMKKCSDENIVIQLGKEDRESIVATHFPCSCISDGECLIITCESEKVEESQKHCYKPIYPRENYSVFYIDTVGGLFTKKKRLFRNTAVKQFKSLCVYGEKGMTVEEALKRDGRFIDDLGDFTLSDNRSPKSITERKQKVDNLDQKEFKIRLPRNKRPNDEKQQESSGASNNSQNRWNTRALDQRGVSVREEMEKSGSSVDIEEIYKLLRDQFPRLKEWMESRFPGDSFQEELNLRREDFGKIQQSFSEVHRVRKLIKLGESVCKVVVENVCVGTGFVLFDNFILTNAHLFKNCVEGQQLNEGVKVFALFNYEDPEPHTNYHCFQVAQSHSFCYKRLELDYIILELNPEGCKPNDTTQKKVNVPPGLLKEFGPIPEDGEACIIGHPAGEVKKMDPTCIIEKENREQVVIVQSLNCKPKGIEKIMMGGIKADKVVTYNTFMYHGSSGSPVFDAHGRVFGLHSGGYPHGPSKKDFSVIEFAYPVLTIFEDFVRMLKESGKEELLKRVKQVAKGKRDLEKVLVSVSGPLSNKVVKNEPADTESLGSD